MKILIVEDEPLAAERLEMMVRKFDPSITVVSVIDTVKEAVAYLSKYQNSLDLIFMDIQLADGQSFEIFEHVEIRKPIIFVTAFDAYALEAFKVNSIDYLMKPTKQEDLNQALRKLHNLRGKASTTAVDKELLEQMSKSHYKSRFLVKSGQKMFFKHIPEISHFFAEDKFCYLIESGSYHKYLMDHNLESLQSMLNPEKFFRINRSVILNIESIREIRKHDTHRFQVSVAGNDDPFIVSRAKTSSFKSWLEG